MVSQDIYIHNSSTLSGFFDIRGNHYCISVVQYVSCRGLNCPFLVEHLPLTFACFFFVFFWVFNCRILSHVYLICQSNTTACFAKCWGNLILSPLSFSFFFTLNRENMLIILLNLLGVVESQMGVELFFFFLEYSSQGSIQSLFILF